jgi:hypothetical protein
MNEKIIDLTGETHVLMNRNLGFYNSFLRPPTLKTHNVDKLTLKVSEGIEINLGHFLKLPTRSKNMVFIGDNYIVKTCLNDTEYTRADHASMPPYVANSNYQSHINSTCESALMELFQYYFTSCIPEITPVVALPDLIWYSDDLTNVGFLMCKGTIYESVLLEKQWGYDNSSSNNRHSSFFMKYIKRLLYLHRFGFAHCDTKPENMVLYHTSSSNCTPMIFDVDVSSGSISDLQTDEEGAQNLRGSINGVRRSLHEITRGEYDKFKGVTGFTPNYIWDMRYDPKHKDAFLAWVDQHDCGPAFLDWMNIGCTIRRACQQTSWGGIKKQCIKYDPLLLFGTKLVDSLMQVFFASANNVSVEEDKIELKNFETTIPDLWFTSGLRLNEGDISFERIADSPSSFVFPSYVRPIGTWSNKHKGILTKSNFKISLQTMKNSLESRYKTWKSLEEPTLPPSSKKTSSLPPSSKKTSSLPPSSKKTSSLPDEYTFKYCRELRKEIKGAACIALKHASSTVNAKTDRYSVTSSNALPPVEQGIHDLAAPTPNHPQVIPHSSYRLSDDCHMPYPIDDRVSSSSLPPLTASTVSNNTFCAPINSDDHEDEGINVMDIIKDISSYNPPHHADLGEMALNDIGIFDENNVDSIRQIVKHYSSDLRQHFVLYRQSLVANKALTPDWKLDAIAVIKACIKHSSITDKRNYMTKLLYFTESTYDVVTLLELINIALTSREVNETGFVGWMFRDNFTKDKLQKLKTRLECRRRH